MTPEQLADIHERAFESSRGWGAAEFTSLLASPHCFVTGSETGFALGRVVADEAELLTIATHPDARRTGVGMACLDAFHKEATARGAKSAFLEVAADNAPAIGLYLKAGWKKSGIRKNYYRRDDGNRVDAVTMALKLC